MKEISIFDEIEPIGENCFTCGNRITWLSPDDPMQLTCKRFHVNITCILKRKNSKSVCFCLENGLQQAIQLSLSF